MWQCKQWLSHNNRFAYGHSLALRGRATSIMHRLAHSKNLVEPSRSLEAAGTVGGNECRENTATLA